QLTAARVLAAAPETDELMLSFLPGDAGSPMRSAGPSDALLDVGALGAAACRRAPCAAPAVSRRVRVLVQSRSGAARFARVRAWVANDGRPWVVRIDGITLTGTPQLIDASAPIGTAVAHVVEIEVPREEPEGSLLAPIHWQAETD
ncbi:MAG: hypothetical protein ACK4N5_08320, partial [Myxococcales bacterium]